METVLTEKQVSDIWAACDSDHADEFLMQLFGWTEPPLRDLCVLSLKTVYVQDNMTMHVRFQCSYPKPCPPLSEVAKQIAKCVAVDCIELTIEQTQLLWPQDDGRWQEHNEDKNEWEQKYG